MKHSFKKIFTLGFILLASVVTPKATTKPHEVLAEETKTIYLKVNDNWAMGDARFAAYVWVAPEADPAWFSMTPVVGEDLFYSVEIPIAPYNHLIFNRMNPSSANTWDGRWNQTSDLDLDFSSPNNMYVLYDDEWGENEHGDNSGKVIGYWSTYLPTIIDPDPDPDPDNDIEPSVYTIHYWRNDNKQAANYSLWLWSEGQQGAAYPFTSSKTLEGKSWRVLQVASTFFNHPQWLDLIIRLGDWEAQTPDIRIDVTDYPIEMDGETPRRNFFLVDMETTVYKSAADAVGEKVLDAQFSAKNKVSVTTYLAPASYEYKIDGVVNKTGNVSTTEQNYKHKFDFTVDNNVDVTKDYSVSVTFKTTNVVKSKTITLNGLFNDPFFIENLTYDGEDLGVTYTPQQTTFKVWAPTSKSLKINLYDNGTPLSVSKEKGDNTIKETLTMTRGDKGTWTATKTGDLHGTYYTLVAENTNGVVELTDPYAKATGVNGARGMIVDFSKTNPTGWENVSYSAKLPTEIVPYELHVSDLTADASWNGHEDYRKKFLGLTQEGTMYQKNGQAVKTGFDHIVELGVNAVQILPFYDQQNDETKMEFNWGYNPQNYNVLEGSYSTDPYNGLVRINEFKQVVQAFANKDIRIIMDVVYNHVASISQHSFTKLVPGYYFRYYEDGSPNNSSGVGNVTASERKMMENYMRDSTAFWVSEYKISGFRFDLMGLHTVNAMNKLATKLKSLRNDIVIYGEPWTMHDYANLPVPDLATQDNIHKMAHVGAFNDAGRDAIKGGSWDNSARVGWVQSSGHEVDRLIDGTMGKITNGTNNPSQVVNYISVHDNYTIYDHLRTANRQSNLGYSADILKAQALQAEAISLLSQGMGFVHAGSEMLRSKPIEGGSAGYYDHNSYKSSYNVNSIKWAEKWDNMTFFNAYRQMIALKRHAPAFNYATRALVDANSTAAKSGGKTNLVRLGYKNNADNYVIYHYGPGIDRETISDLTDYEVILDTSNTLARGSVISGNIRLTVNTTLIVRNVRDRGTNDLTIPPTIGYTDYAEPIDPVDPNDPASSSYTSISEDISSPSEISEVSETSRDTSVPVDSGTVSEDTSMPPTTSLPDEPQTSDPGASSEPTPAKTGCFGNISATLGMSGALIGVMIFIALRRRSL